MTTYRIESCQADSPFNVPQNTQIWKPCDKKWRHNDIITKNNEKMRTSAKPNKLYIIRKVLMRAIQKCIFYWIWVTMSKVIGIYVKFWHFYDARYPNMAMSSDPRSKFRKKFILPNSAFNIGKSCKIIVEKLSTSEVVSRKPHGGGKHPPPPSAFRVKNNQQIFHDSNKNMKCRITSQGSI